MVALLPPHAVAPDAPALIARGQSLLWRDLWAQMTSRALELQATGGHRVGLHSSDDAWLVPELFALMQAGASVVLAHPRWSTERAQAALEQVGAAWRSTATLTDRSLPPAPPAPPVPNGEACVVFTSGSSGQPKGVSLSVPACVVSAQVSAKALSFGPGKRWLVSLPLCHVGGFMLLLRAAHSGGALVLRDRSRSLVQDVECTHPTHLSLVATQLLDLLNTGLSGAALSALCEVVVGGGPVASALVERAKAKGLPLRQTWGMSETAAMVALSEKGQAENCGGLLSGWQVRIGVGGQLKVKGPALFSGYLAPGGEVRSCLDAEGFFETGDLGDVQEFQSCGNVKVVGRADERFISGGENIDPSEVESAILSHLGILQAVVVPVPDARFGERPAAFLQFRWPEKKEETLAELSNRMKNQLPSYMRPVAYWELSVAQGTKVQRAQLRERALRLQIEKSALNEGER